MNKFKKITPEGFFDILYPESYKKVEVEKSIQKVFRSFGYYPVKLPLLEYFEVFENEFLDNTNTFKLVDSKGRIIVLRPDITMPIARLVSSKLSTSQLPIKLSYTDSVFRLNHTYGKSREVFQTGIELIGARNPLADAEIITVAIEAIMSSGIEKFQIDIGQIEFFKSIVNNLNLSKSEIETIRDLIDKKDFLGVEKSLDYMEIPDSKKEILLNLHSYYGDIKVLENVLSKCDNQNEIDSLEYLKQVHNILVLRGYENFISIDLAMLNNINYYSGIIIRGFSYGTGYPILSGGRYDNLLEGYGKRNTAVGFSININELLISINRQNILFDIPKTKILVAVHPDAIEEAYHIAKKLRENDQIVEEDMVGLKIDEIKEYIKNRNICDAIYIEKNKVSIFNVEEDSEILEFTMDMFYKFMGDEKWSI